MNRLIGKTKMVTINLPERSNEEISSYKKSWRSPNLIWNFLQICLLALLLVLIPIICYSETPGERVKEFYTNLYTGKGMKDKDWITKQMRATRMWRAFGGLSARVTGTTADAQKHSGLKSITVTNLSEKDTLVYVSIEVTFNDNSKDTVTGPWAKENGKWKMTIPPDYEESFH